MALDRRLDSAYWALRIGLGLGPLLAGLDKFFNILTDWGMYLSPLHLGPLERSQGGGLRKGRVSK